MAAYSSETIHIKPGVFKNFEEMVPKKLQPVLDAGSQSGKKLHSVQLIPDAQKKGYSFLVIWEA